MKGRGEEAGDLDSDEQLLSRIRRGDREALGELYGRHLPGVWRYVLAQLRGDEQTARDAVSETFLAAIRSLVKTDVAVANVGGWLMGIARHKVRDVRRSVRSEISEGKSAMAADPAAALEAADVRQGVARAMDRMDDDERTVLEWKYIEGLSVREISGRLGRTEKGVEALLYRARKSFRQFWRT